MPSDRKLLVGVDEAGYGPNLGPLVVVAAWLKVPERTRSDCLWDRLRPTVCRHPATDGAAMVVDDSKRVYAAGNGLDHLERAALVWTALSGNRPTTLRELWTSHCLTALDDADESAWSMGQGVELPRSMTRERVDADRDALSLRLGQAGFSEAGLACQIILPRRFNELLRRGDSKAAALFQVNAELLRHIWSARRADPIEVVLDKHGGRNFYGALLQQEFHETLVLAGREGPAASHYTLSADGRRLEARFIPRADSQHFLVALASMTAKYLRELWMERFNAFWLQQIPGLRPTAGYPVDARRFWQAIEPVTARLRIDRDSLWRER